MILWKIKKNIQIALGLVVVLFVLDMSAYVYPQLKPARKVFDKLVTYKKFKRTIHLRYKKIKYQILVSRDFKKNVGLSMLSLLLIVLAISKLRKKASPVGKRELHKILESLNLIYEEVTKDPVMKITSSGREPKKDSSGRVVYKEILHIPKVKVHSEKAGFTITGIHERCQANFIKYFNGLIELMFKKNMISFEIGEFEATGFPGEYIVKGVSKSGILERDLFKSIGWYRKEVENGITKEIYPYKEIDSEKRSVSLHLNGLSITEEKIKSKLSDFSKFINLNLDKKFEKFNDKYVFEITKEISTKWQKGENGVRDIAANFDLWQETVVSKLKAAKSEQLYLGEIVDPTIKMDETEIFWDIKMCPHMMVAGATRSGKSKTLIGVIADLAAAYPKAIWYFGDAKSSADFVPVAKALSVFPVAIVNPTDPTIEFANVVTAAWNHYVNRQRVLKEASHEGYDCSTFLELREASVKANMPEWYFEKVFLVIDEFAALQTLMKDPSKLMNTEGTILWMIKKLLAESASYGITIILASQRVQADSFPTPIRSNLTAKLMHIMNQQDANFLENPDLVKLKTGQYYLDVNGLMDKNNQNKIKCTHVYVGDNPQEVFELLDITPPEKKPFDFDLLYNSGESIDFDKMGPLGVSKYVKQLFLVKEGFKIMKQYGADLKLLSMFAEKGGQKYALGFIDINEFLGEMFLENLERESSVDLNEYTKIFFVTGKEVTSEGKTKALSGLVQTLGIGNSIVLVKQQYMRDLKLAFDLYKEDKTDLLFTKQLQFIDKKQEDTVEGRLEELYKHANDEEMTLSVDELLRISAIKKPKDKGDQFEGFYMKFERAQGHDTVFARELIEKKIVNMYTANSRAEGGADLIRWVNKDKKEAIIIQLKNVTSRALNNDVLGKTESAKRIYQKHGLKVVGMMVVTTGKVTKQLNAHAKDSDIIVIDGEQLKKMVNEHMKKTIGKRKENGDD
jgi:hypothetical protein